jgi:hypothetical protein
MHGQARSMGWRIITDLSQWARTELSGPRYEWFAIIWYKMCKVLHTRRADRVALSRAGEFPKKQGRISKLIADYFTASWLAIGGLANRVH